MGWLGELICFYLWDSFQKVMFSFTSQTGAAEETWPMKRQWTFPGRTQKMFVRVPDVREQFPRFPELVVIKSEFKADESSQVSSL